MWLARFAADGRRILTAGADHTVRLWDLASEEPMFILTVLARELRRAWTIREWSLRGQAPDQIARNMRIPPRVAEAIVAWLDKPLMIERQSYTARRCG